MAARNVCRFLPNDQAVIDQFVHNVAIYARVLHGRDLVTNKVVTQPGEQVDLSEVDLSKVDQSKVDQSKVDQSKVDQSKVDQSKVAHNDLVHHLRAGLSAADEEVTNKVVTQPGEQVDQSKVDQSKVTHKDLVHHLHARLSAADEEFSDNKFRAQELRGVLREFLEFIEKDSVTNMLFKQMFEQAKPPAPGQQGAKDYVDLLNQFNFILRDPPKFATGASAMVAAVPYYALLSRFCNTPSGFTAFTDPTINDFLRRMLDEWHAFLLTEASTGMLTDKKEGGWFTDVAVNAMVDAAGKPGKSFQDVFDCKPEHPSGKYGFRNYDEFFTKELVGLKNKEMIEDAYNKETVNMP
ncbi:hypothetical protein ID866_10966, partial [Astraeus odoratus]